jgi:hypothetical protein
VAEWDHQIIHAAEEDVRCLLALLLMSAAVGSAQDTLTRDFVGTAINTTNPDKPVAAIIHMTVGSGGCKLTVLQPLNGSGSCRIKSFDEKTGRLEFVSDGPPIIVWSGTVKGNLASGSYKIDVGAQTGTFYLAITSPSNEEAEPSPKREPAPAVRVAPNRGSCVPVIESAITGEIEGWDGETIFKLDNGQIWQQAEYDYTYFYEYHPDVTIYQTSAGCRMKVEDEDETVLVKRIK